MPYSFDDFTEIKYADFLKLTNLPSIFYEEIMSKDKFLLWRHDIDHSIHRAKKLAVLEKKYFIKATYFLQLGSFFYNIFEEEIKELVLNILSLGHQIGLHFDPTQYKINTKEDLEKYLNFEKNILENLFQVEIKVFSFHNPTEEILKYDDFKYSDMINTYAKYFKENVEYCSDSNGYWRYKSLEDFLNEKHTKIQVLTHPGWWQKEAMSPRNRIQRCIDGRANNTAKKYDGLLDKHGRENVR